MTANFDYLKHLQVLRQRAKLLCPAMAETVGSDLEQMIVNLTGDPSATAEERKTQVSENKAAMEDLIGRHRSGDAAASAELTKLREIRVQNLLFARSNVMQFFDMVTLEPNEVAEFVNDTLIRLNVSYIGQDGGFKRATAQRHRERVQIPMFLLSTEDYEYPLKDMYKGAVADEAKALVNLSWEMDRKVEGLTWPYLKSQIGAFTLTGPSSLRTWFLNNGVDITNIPTTNLLLPKDSGTMTNTSPFRKECLDAILRYAASWGDAWPDGMVAPVAIYVPSSEAMGFLEQVTLTTQSNPLSDQVMMTGFVFDYGGVKWNIIPDSTLSPAEGLAYVRMNKPAGTFFTKPFMDEILEDLSIKLRKQNKGTIAMVKAVGWGVPNTAKVNVAAVQYHLAR